ncbi:hypothetical protein [Nocardioides yefusunii]|uniref:Uncharacterized protein n=1 Tax=Nocardioides yefusunii TaxID=2500546 RepID=A0ABW1QWI6_9ACTN|nr:hypothetical protein [Nocardioides yefusunii]
MTATPTPDDFRALARSSPWLCTSAHITRRMHRDGVHQVVEAWLRRPGELTVLDENGEHSWAAGMQTYVPPSVVAAWSGMPERYADDVVAARAASLRWVHAAEPMRREDGLVAVRPDQGQEWLAATGQVPEAYEVDDPMYDNYVWVAMLDPLELSAGVALRDVNVTTHHGREAWAALAVTEPAYEPRCGCCPLLENAHTARQEYGDEKRLVAAAYPVAHRVVLDRATGFVVSVAPVWGREDGRRDLGFDLEIHASA